MFLFMFSSSPACALRMLERSDVEKHAKTNRCYKIGTLECITLQVATKLEPFGSLNHALIHYKIGNRAKPYKTDTCPYRIGACYKIGALGH